MSTDAAADTQPAPHQSSIAWRGELFVAILLAVATVATAWSSYQSARWSGSQTINFSAANADRVESTRLSTQAGQQAQIDVTTFVAWAEAYAAGQEELTEFFADRFRDEFAPAVEAWVATKPLENPDAPPVPFAMPEYQLAAEEEADRLARSADAASAQAKADNQRSDNYVLAVVLFASALFFAGISTKLDRPRMRNGIVILGYVLFIGTVIWLATFPVSIGV